MFNINFTYLINILLPPLLRLDKQIAWIEVVLSQAKIVYNKFVELREFVKIDVNFKGQLMYLEKKLQQEFNCSGIYIGDGFILYPVYLWNLSENQTPIYLYPIGSAYVYEQVYLFNHREYVNEIDFIVYIPNSCSLSQTEINKLKNIVDFYKIIENRYKIEYYNE